MPIDPALLTTLLAPATLRDPVLASAEIKLQPEDFVVEELPAYLPCGEGEHLFLWVEKRGLSGPDLLSRLARVLKIRAGDIGVAGQKDRHAVTRQFVSVHRDCADRISDLNADDLSVLSATRHQNKLRTGHLLGNRFHITLRHSKRPFTSEEWELVDQRLQQLQTGGFVSSFGPQRFGHGGNTLENGLDLLAGRFSRKRWSFHQQRFMTRLVLSAVQSAVFNLVVHQRTIERTVEHPLAGDVVIRKHGTRPFLYVPGTTDNRAGTGAERCPLSGADSVEGTIPPEGTEAPAVLIPAGPMPGPQMLQTLHEPLQRERDALDCLGLDGNEFERFARHSQGTRRPMLAFPQQAGVIRTEAGHLQLHFELAPGTYATTLLREICADIIDRAGQQHSPDGAVDADEHID